jgi:S-DNA-T family DNA segregation ATPase FtsK/SpoIIIE
MIDPKLVELSIFDGLPHLIGRIINTAEDAKKALGWLVEEMEHRYRILAQHYVRDIDTYIKEGGRMPYIVVIVDELADLMLTSAHECEDRIVRLAQMARAVGIHLVLATQRPSVDVVTGIIKANVPGRIAFYLASKADSRTILDRVGAEKLLGQGDMLYIEPGMQKPIRIQGSYISNAELTLVVSHLRKRRVEEDHLSASLLKALQQKEREGIDPLYEEAKKIAMEEENLSVSLLQRKLRVGFNRAARLMEQLREEGVFQKE